MKKMNDGFDLAKMMVMKGSTMGAISFVAASSFLAVEAFEATVRIWMMVVYDGEYTFYSKLPNS